MQQWRPHAIKGNKTSEGPAQLFAFHCVTTPERVSSASDTVRHSLRVGVALACRIEDGSLSRQATHVFHSPLGWLSALCATLSRHRPVWVYAHDLLWHWRLVGGFRLIEAHDPKLWRVVLGDRVRIFRGRVRGLSVRACDLTNYYQCDLKTLAASQGVTLPPEPSGAAAEGECREFCLALCRVLCTTVANLQSDRRRNDLGSWGPTAAQLAWRNWRHTLGDVRVYPHRAVAALGLERGCLVGGRVETHRLGVVPGPVYHVDVNSLYPSVMRDYPYPRRLERYVVGPSVEWVRRSLEKWCVCAHVWLDTDEPRYPKKRPPLLRGEGRRGKTEEAWPAQATPGRVYYPVGTFRTYLCGLELLDAIDRGHVLRAESAALYECADLFSRYVNYWWGRRQAARGNPAEEQLCKLYLNSLWGKFCQRAPDRVCTGGEIPPDGSPWHHWYRRDARDGEVYECQAIAGVVTEEVRGDGSWDSFPAVAAHVCANARAVMWRIKDCWGAGHYYYEDTDSILGDECGYAHGEAAGWVRPTELGYLKRVGVYEEVEIWGPKHYRVGGREVHAGFEPGDIDGTRRIHRCQRRDGVDGCIAAWGGVAPCESTLVRRLPGRHANGILTDDGCVLPFRLDCALSAQLSDGPLADRTNGPASALRAEES